MQNTYSEISNYWEANPCSGGNKTFPFYLWEGARVLEIGCGTGVDARRFMQAKANYTGIDLTKNDVDNCVVMNAEYLEFPDETFDLVYSFGVIHHAISPENIMKEIKRVLKPNGHLCIMLYNKPSWRDFEINVLRRILWFFHFPKFKEIRKKYPHPTKEEWISINTDTLGCPLSRIYNKKQSVELLSGFRNITTWTENNSWFRMLIGTK